MMRNAITQYYANTKLIPLITQIITHDYSIHYSEFSFLLIITHKNRGGPALPLDFHA